MMNYGIQMGKMARTKTRIGHGSVSVSSAGVELMEANTLKDLQKDPDNLHVTVVGAGVMSRRLLQVLFKKLPNIHLTLVNRNVDNAKALLAEVACTDDKCMMTDVATLEGMREAIKQSDVVFTASSSETPIITADDLRGLDRKLMLVDISVPRNVHPNCAGVEGVHSYSVDDLAKIQEKNNEARQVEVGKAKALIEEQLQKFEEWHHARGQFQSKTNVIPTKEHIYISNEKVAVVA
jgi:glutamyl-tRNA reductase